MAGYNEISATPLKASVLSTKQISHQSLTLRPMWESFSLGGFEAVMDKDGATLQSGHCVGHPGPVRESSGPKVLLCWVAGLVQGEGAVQSFLPSTHLQGHSFP